MYNDWALSRTLFQWDSPNSWTSRKGQGQAFLQQITDGIPLYLFVRETKRDDFGRPRPFKFLGPVHIVPGSLNGEYPYSLQLELEKAMPMGEFRNTVHAGGGVKWLMVQASRNFYYLYDGDCLADCFMITPPPP